MTVGRFIVVGCLVLGTVVYVAVIAMCRAAGHADRAEHQPEPPSGVVLVDLDGTVLHGFTPPNGLPRMRPPVPTPRNGVPVIPGGRPGDPPDPRSRRPQA